MLQIKYEEETAGELRDYKFFCFGGEPRLCQVISDRSSCEKIDFYDMGWNRLAGLVGLSGNVRNSGCSIPRPRSFGEMRRIAAALAGGIPFARIDLYEIGGRPYFGEITFFPASGFGEFRPAEWNARIGSMLNLDIIRKQ